MTFSIKATMRGWWASEHRLTCPATLWRQIISELDRRGERLHEAGAFLLGVEKNGHREVKSAVYYDDLDANAYSTGVCVLYGDAFSDLWARCRAERLTVVADVHTHRDTGFQSHADKTNPMVARAGHIAIIVPDFARWPIRESRMGIYEYQGQYEWINRSPDRVRNFFYTRFWS
jgi:hypothetical protein